MCSMTGRFTGLAVACGVLSSAQLAPSQPAMDAKTLLGSAASAYMNLKQYELTIVNSFESVSKAGERESETKTYKIAIERPDRIRIELNDDNTLFGLPLSTGGPGGPVFVIGTGDTTWVYVPLRIPGEGEKDSGVNAKSVPG